MEPIDFPSRIRRLAEALSNAGVDAYLGTRRASLHYLAGAFAPWRGGVLVTSSGDAEMIYWAMDSDRVRREGWGLPVVEWGADNPGFVEMAARRLTERGLAKGRIALDISIAGTGQEAPGVLYAHELVRLEELLPDASLENGTSHIDNLMLIKAPEELARLRFAAKAADAGFAAGLNAVRPGVTENAVAGAIEEATRMMGSTWAWSITAGTEVGSGYRTAFARGVTQQATEKRIEENEFVILDLHPMIELYLADLGLPVFTGRPDKAQQRLIDCWEETVEVLLAGLRPGRAIAEVCREGLAVFAKYGLQDYGLPMFGHGLGTCARLGPFMNPKSKDTLQAGMVLALGTHLYVPGTGGLRLEYPIAITESGAEPLCRTAPRVHIKP
jgi:Xaa-Pro dipeptidase